MQPLTILLASLSSLALTSATPIIARNVCGAAPSGSTAATPLAEPSDITTPAACEAACKADTFCEAFVCGFVSSAPVCMLYSVPASSIPTQSNSNLLAYDIACSPVPTGKLTASNPTGSNTEANTAANAVRDTTTNASPLLARDVCGSAPGGTTAVTPIAQPSEITTPAACQVACKADTSCKAFVCGFASSAPVCMLYSVSASLIPTQSSSNFLAYDLACSSVPEGTLSATNPTGATNQTPTTNPTPATSPASANNPADGNNPAEN